MTISTDRAIGNVNAWLPESARLTNIRPEVPGISTYELTLDDASRRRSASFRCGQFNMLYLPGYGEVAISISSAPDRPEVLDHTIRAAGTVTREIAKQQIGDPIGIRGPFGSAWPVEDCRGCDLVIACGGVGLAPLRPVLCHILRHRSDFGRVFLLYGARTPNDLLYREQYDVWRQAGIEVEITVDLADADWRGHIGVVPVLFYRLRLQPAHTCIFTCGPEIMMRFVIFEALARRLQPDQVFVSMERNMRCGFGQCGHCQLGPLFVCRDGPVFSYERLEPFFNLEDF